MSAFAHAFFGRHLKQPGIDFPLLEDRGLFSLVEVVAQLVEPLFLGHRRVISAAGMVRFRASMKPRTCNGGETREEVERETGFEPATFCLGSRHSAS